MERMLVQLLREMPEIVDKDKIWEWTRKSDLKVETEALIFEAQEQVRYSSSSASQWIPHFVDCVVRRLKQ